MGSTSAGAGRPGPAPLATRCDPQPPQARRHGGCLRCSTAGRAPGVHVAHHRGPHRTLGKVQASYCGGRSNEHGRSYGGRFRGPAPVVRRDLPRRPRERRDRAQRRPGRDRPVARAAFGAAELAGGRPGHRALPERRHHAPRQGPGRPADRTQPAPRGPTAAGGAGRGRAAAAGPGGAGRRRRPTPGQGALRRVPPGRGRSARRRRPGGLNELVRGAAHSAVPGSGGRAGDGGHRGGRGPGGGHGRGGHPGAGQGRAAARRRAADPGTGR